MNDDSSPQGLKNLNPKLNEDFQQDDSLKSEWSMLIRGFIEDGDESLDKGTEVATSQLTSNMIQSALKELSQKRRKLNREIEAIKEQMDELVTLQDNLQLVGSDTESTTQEMDRLSVEGEKLSYELKKLDDYKKKLRIALAEITSSEGHSAL